jgi:hypothetical protein
MVMDPIQTLNKPDAACLTLGRRMYRLWRLQSLSAPDLIIETEMRLVEKAMQELANLHADEIKRNESR